MAILMPAISDDPAMLLTAEWSPNIINNWSHK